MKIGMILDASFPPDPRVENEAISLISAGHEVHLFCLAYSPDFKEKQVYKGIHVYRYYCNRLNYKLSALAYTLPFYHKFLRKHLKSFLADTNVDILHVHDIQSARAVFQLNHQYKIILDLHENRPEIMKYYPHVNSLRGRFLISPEKWRSFEKKYIEEAYRVIVVTEPAKRHYVEMTRSATDKFIVVPNTIRKAFYESPSYHEEITTKYKDTYNLLYMGDTGVRRGTLELIQAVAIVRTKITNVKLIMVGKSQEDEILRQEIAQLNLHDHVKLTGWQNFETFQSYLKVSKIGFSPLHRNLHHDTTFANKIFQYLCFGLPIVVSDATAQKEVVEQFNCGYSYPANNVQALAECILKLYEDLENYQRMSEQAILAVRTKYNWETTSAELINFYANLSSQVPYERHLEPNH